MLDALVPIAQVLTPIFLLVLGGLGWYIQQSVERRVRIEEKLHADRLEIYNKILEPYFLMFMSDAAWAMDPKTKGKDKGHVAIEKLLSWDYRKTGLQLSLIGSDGVVLALNKLMQHAFKVDQNAPVSTTLAAEMLALMGNLLLEIRKSAGNESTIVDKFGMVEWFVVAPREFR